MSARAERAAGIDHHLRDTAALGRPLPRRPDVDPARHQLRLVEALPALLPVVGQRLAAHLDQRAARGGLQLAELGQLARRAVDRVLDHAGAAVRLVHLLDSPRRQLQQLCQHRLRLTAAAA